jgi:hypothetical protein
MTMGVISSPKTRKQRPKNASVSCHAGDSKEPLSLNSGLTVNSSDQSPNHLSIKFVIYSPIFLHKSMMNVTFSNKKCSRHCFHPRFFLSHFLSFRFLWTKPSCTLGPPFIVPLHSPLKYFYRNQSFRNVQQSIQRVHAIDVALTNGEPNEHSLFLFQIFY